MPGKLRVGVDGGATKTLAVAADERGNVIGVHESGPSNYHVVGLDGAVENINTAIRGALAPAGAGSADVVVLGLAGMDTAYDFKLFEEKAVPRIIGRRVYVRHDAEIALVGATLGKPGVIVIAGTGSVAGARNRRGEYARCGGWGYLVGDEGSAFYIACEALRAVLWAFDGRGAQTALTTRILEALGISSPDEILRKLYVEKMSISDVAKLAPIVTELASAGDAVARRIVEEAAKHLALHVVALVDKLSMRGEQPIKVATVGGVFRAGPVILEPFKRHLEEQFKVELIKPELPPVAGALLLAYLLDGVEVEGTIVENLRSSLRRYGLLS
ncbi:MAG: BadF/BadG/BcrA/BcrD ATPase family protein [Thermofilaceae archaeon]